MSLHTEDSHWGLRTSHWDGDERISLIRNNWAKRTFLCVMLNLISTQKGKIWIVCSQAKCAACSSVSYTLKTWMNIKKWIIKSPSLSWSSCSKLCQDFLAFLFILTHQLRSVPRGDRKPIKHLNGKTNDDINPRGGAKVGECGHVELSQQYVEKRLRTREALSGNNQWTVRCWQGWKRQISRSKLNVLFLVPKIRN